MVFALLCKPRHRRSEPVNTHNIAVAMSCGAVVNPPPLAMIDGDREEREKENLITMNVRSVDETGSTQLNMNYLHLSSVPPAIGESESCRDHVQKLFFKGNVISELVYT